jgi:hypothetical protein
VAKGLPQAQKDDLLGKAATLLLDALDKETDAHARERLDWALAEVAKGLPAQRLLDALAKEKDANARFRLAAALGEVAKGLPQAQKDDLLDQATTLLLDALDKETDAHARERLAAALREVVKGLPADKAAKVLLETLDKEKNRDAQCWLASALAEVAERLPQARKADLRHQAAKFVILSRDIPKNAKIREGLAEDLAKGATEAGVPKGTILLFQALAQQPALEEQNLAALEHMATQMEMPVAVDLLKQPLCYGKARQILLRRVEQLTGQTFPSRWDMVDYLRRHRPDIDLDTPPQRPDE